MSVESCARCHRPFPGWEAREAIKWEQLDEELICPGCLTREEGSEIAADYAEGLVIHKDELLRGCVAAMEQNAANPDGLDALEDFARLHELSPVELLDIAERRLAERVRDPQDEEAAILAARLANVKEDDDL